MFYVSTGWISTHNDYNTLLDTDPIMCFGEERYAFIVVMITGIVTFTLGLTHVIYMLIAEPLGYEAQLYGPVIWSIIQIPITVFSHRARQELTTR
jgi:hypothetical protein